LKSAQTIRKTLTKFSAPISPLSRRSITQKPEIKAKESKYDRTRKFFMKMINKYTVTASLIIMAGSSYIIYDQWNKFTSPYARSSESVTANALTTTTILDLSEIEDEDTQPRPSITSPIQLIIHTVQKVFSFISLTFRVIRLLFLFAPVAIYFGYQHYLSPSSFDSWCRYLVSQMQKAGPCFIKLAQWAGTRKDLFGDVLCYNLSTMHSNAPSHSFSDTRRIIESEFKEPLEKVFIEFSKDPIASGAIAQVYLAKNAEGVECAVKVRHPRVVQKIARDLQILQFFTRIISYYPPLRWASLQENISVFSKSMKAQTDLRVEGTNLQLFKNNFKSFSDTIVFPTPDMLRTTPQVLVETYMRGTPIQSYLDDVSNQVYSAATKKLIGQYGINMYLKMMLVDNFVHADMHPGNLLVDTVDGEPKLIVLDAGLVTKLSSVDRVNFIDLFSAVAAGDGFLAASLMIERARNAQDVAKNPDAVSGFKKEMSVLIDKVLVTPVSELEVGIILEQVLTLGRKYRVPVESNFTTLVLGTMIIEGIGKQLDPDLNFVDSSKPFLVKESAVRDAYIRGMLGNEHKLYQWYERWWKNSKWNINL